MDNTGWKILQGSQAPANGAADATVIAAQGSGTVIRVLRGVISVTTAATGGGGVIALEDGVGGTRFVEIPAAAVGNFYFDFGPEGYALTANTLLNATTDTAVTTQATARVTVIAKV